LSSGVAAHGPGSLSTPGSERWASWS